jgi:glycine dehydrogenase subunit 1
MYFPHTPQEREAMLETIGVKQLEDLFQAVPASHRFPDLTLPPSLTEMDALQEMQSYAWANSNTRELVHITTTSRLQ